MKSGIHLRQVINKLNQIDFHNSKDLHLFGQIYENFLNELQSTGQLGEFYTPRAITQFMVEIINPQHGELMLDPACGTGGFLTATIDYLKPNAIPLSNTKLSGRIYKAGNINLCPTCWQTLI
ncbi:class I SAM-dependent DNA methyltransferase [Candidatus Nitrosacidococcus sp. I8]|uniref:HsdM family class I SAM-dependent methyltransferase n=1 Tax=Candidatus Nitrosacidococcus sp. I8 TaxID=2942908 RepID=UPI0022264C63|nr:N-6 DNA methylase [Candidatus Nitrosacidococcus sp. I8]